jgi:hypothetical protein
MPSEAWISRNRAGNLPCVYFTSTPILAACECHVQIGSIPGPPNIPDKIPDPVMVISQKLTKGKFHQGGHGHGRATNNSKFYSSVQES